MAGEMDSERAASADEPGPFPQGVVASPDEARPTHPVPDTPLGRSQTAYLDELPELLKGHRGEWVAYADGKRLRFGVAQAELYRHCLKGLGLTHDQFIVRRIMPDGGQRIEYTLR